MNLLIFTNRVLYDHNPPQQPLHSVSELLLLPQVITLTDVTIGTGWCWVAVSRFLVSYLFFRKSSRGWGARAAFWFRKEERTWSLLAAPLGLQLRPMWHFHECSSAATEVLPFAKYYFAASVLIHRLVPAGSWKFTASLFLVNRFLVAGS